MTDKPTEFKIRLCGGPGDGKIVILPGPHEYYYIMGQPEYKLLFGKFLDDVDLQASVFARKGIYAVQIRLTTPLGEPHRALWMGWDSDPVLSWPAVTARIKEE